MRKMSSNASSEIKQGLINLVNAALELSNILDKNNYTLSDATPDFLADCDDFAYELQMFYEDENKTIDEITEVDKIYTKGA